MNASRPACLRCIYVSQTGEARLIHERALDRKRRLHGSHQRSDRGVLGAIRYPARQPVYPEAERHDARRQSRALRSSLPGYRLHRRESSHAPRVEIHQTNQAAADREICQPSYMTLFVESVSQSESSAHAQIYSDKPPRSSVVYLEEYPLAVTPDATKLPSWEGRQRGTERVLADEVLVTRLASNDVGGFSSPQQMTRQLTRHQLDLWQLWHQATLRLRRIFFSAMALRSRAS